MNLAAEEPGHDHEGSKETCFGELVMVAFHPYLQGPHLVNRASHNVENVMLCKSNRNGKDHYSRMQCQKD